MTDEFRCVICGKGPYQPDKNGEYVGMRDIRCACGRTHCVCFKCWTDPICKVLADAFKGEVKLWMEKDVSFDVCPESVKAAWRMME